MENYILSTIVNNNNNNNNDIMMIIIIIVNNNNNGKVKMVKVSPLQDMKAHEGYGCKGQHSRSHGTRKR